MAETKSKFSPFLKQCFVTGAVCLSVLGHGCVFGFPGVLLPQLRLPRSPVAVSEDMASWIASISAISMFFGNFATPPIMSRAGRRWAQHAVTLPAALGWLCVMLATSSEVGLGMNMDKTEVMVDSQAASISAISMFFGNFATPPIMSRAGRRWAQHAVTLPAALGWLCVMLATSSEILLVGRALHGISAGMSMPLRSVQVGEYCSPARRGGFLTTIALAQAAGILFVHFVGSVASYQLTALISSFFPFGSLLMTLYSPESPSWLATQGRYDECRKVFLWLRGPEEIPELDRMIKASQAQATEATSHVQNRFRDTIDMFKKKEFYKPVALMFILNFIVQFAGGTLMAAYSTVVIHLLLGPEVDAHFWMVALDTQRIFFNLVAVYVINKTKRRTMMFATGALCAGSHLMMAGYVFARKNNYLPFDSLWIPGILINLQVVSVAMGMVPMSSVIPGEVFPLRYRSVAGSVSLVSVSFTIFLVLKTFPGLVLATGLEGTYALYAGVLAAGLGAVMALLPETRGRTLQQIEEQLRGAPAAGPGEGGERGEAQPLDTSQRKPNA